MTQDRLLDDGTTLHRVTETRFPNIRVVATDVGVTFDLTESEHQLYPGDYETQVGQGPITLHSEERLASTDRWVSMVRRQWKQQLRAVEAGVDPVGVSFDENAAPVQLLARNYIVHPG